jgi:putative urate catabolism protein
VAYSPERDLIGYGPNPPDPAWPDGARLALNFVLNYEEGSEYSIPDNDARSDSALTEVGGYDPGVKGRDLAAESMYEYGSRVGFWRVLRLFQERNLPLTVFGCALALERHPVAAEAIKQADYDVCCHGWRWENHYDLDIDEEREHIHRAIKSLERTVGERPYGWYCRYGPGVNTRHLIVEEGGFLYDSDAYNDDLPYWVRVNGHPHLVVPYTLSNNDAKFALGSFSTAREFGDYLQDCFDVMYREGEAHAGMMSVGLHLRVIGHPARIPGLERFLDYVMKHDDVWVTRRIDIARHWIATHPYSN